MEIWMNDLNKSIQECNCQVNILPLLKRVYFVCFWTASESWKSNIGTKVKLIYIISATNLK